MFTSVLVYLRALDKSERHTQLAFRSRRFPARPMGVGSLMSRVTVSSFIMAQKAAAELAAFAGLDRLFSSLSGGRCPRLSI